MGTYTLIVVILSLLVLYFLYKTHKWKALSVQEKTERAQISVLLENLNDGIIEYDGTMKVVRINNKAVNLLGISAVDVVGKVIKPEGASDIKIANLAKISYPAFGEKVKHETETTQSKNPKVITADTYDVMVGSPNEKKIRVFTVAKVEKKSNEPVGFIKVIRDITKEDIISHSKSDLVAVVAHQLRAPLSAIRWIFGSLIDEDYGTLNEKQKELVKKGTTTNQELVGLVDDILDVSKIEEARFDYTFEKVDLDNLIHDIAESLRGKTVKKGVSLIIDMPNTHLEAEFDKERIKMVITNIIDNAINYTKENGTVAVNAKDAGDKIEIYIKDNGIGIPEEAKEKLFSKFYRAKNAKAIKPQGTGLGLFLAKTIVEGHGGKIDYTSKENEGTTFTITLPKKPETPKAGADSNSSPKKVYGI